MTNEEQLSYLAINFLENFGMEAPTELQLQRIEESLAEQLRIKSMVIFVLDRANVKYPTAEQIKLVERDLCELIFKYKNDSHDIYYF